MRKISNISLPDPLSASKGGFTWSLVCDENDVITSIEPMRLNEGKYSEDWQGAWLSPRGMDLQFNGGLGIAFPELTFHQLPKLLELLDQLWVDGVEAICPTFISCALPEFQEAMRVLNEARNQNQLNRCKLLGAHLEGPFLSLPYVGAHNPNCIRKPSLFALTKYINGFENSIDLVTLAPELEGSEELIQQLNSLGIINCLGHSSADFEQSLRSFEKGISMLTHTFNAMQGLHHRNPGPVGAAIQNGKIFMGLIADGIHVHPLMATFLQKIAKGQLVLVSDALSPYGLEEGQYQWNSSCISVEQGVCRLSDGTLAGSTLGLLEGCKRLAKWSNEPSSAIWSATCAPRLVLGQPVALSKYFIGKSLKNLLRWELNFDINELTWCQAV